MKKAIVFGGSGFIGSHVADALTNEGFKVTIFDIKKSSYINKDQKFIQGNILDKKQVERAIGDNDIVYNFAGEVDINESLKKPLETIELNVMGNAFILEACKKQKVKRFIFASTIYVYSDSGGFYRSSKQACELFIEEYHKHFSLDFTILRFGSLYGPRSDQKNWLHSAIKESLEKQTITRKGDGEELREYVHVYDAARLSVKILDKEFKNEYVMITGNQQIRIKDIMEMIKEMLNKKVNLKFVSIDKKQHYEITPYNFSPKLAKKIVSHHYIDLGQGILDLINHIYKENLKK